MSLLASSIKGTSYLIALQAFSRILTFSLNQLILRYTTPSVFGFATIQLELLLNTILFLCREGFRISVQRLPVVSGKDRSQEIINLSCIPVVGGLVVSTVLSALYIQQAPLESVQVPYFKSTVIIYGLSTIVELLAEPGYNIALHKLLFKVRASCEGAAVIVRCIIAFSISLYGRDQYGALAFALGQLSYAITLYIAYKCLVPTTVSPKKLHSGKWLSDNILRLSIANTGQGLLKHVLTEGDKVMISWFSTNEEQGSYALAANYGGLVARIILQPVEEASRSYFSNLMPAKAMPSLETEEMKSASKQHKIVAGTALLMILRLYLNFSCLILAFGPPLINHTLPLILQGSRWHNVTTVLAAYCYYIPLLAINGILEAFVTATASPKTLRNQGLWWVPFSLAFAGAGVYFRDYGATGLVYANCLNLALRVIWALKYVSDTFHGDIELTSGIPSIGSFSTACGAAGFIMTWTENPIEQFLLKAVVLGIVTTTLICICEYSWATRTYRQLRG